MQTKIEGIKVLTSPKVIANIHFGYNSAYHEGNAPNQYVGCDNEAYLAPHDATVALFLVSPSTILRRC